MTGLVTGEGGEKVKNTIVIYIITLFRLLFHMHCYLTIDRKLVIKTMGDVAYCTPGGQPPSQCPLMLLLWSKSKKMVSDEL